MFQKYLTTQYSKHLKIDRSKNAITRKQNKRKTY